MRLPETFQMLGVMEHFDLLSEEMREHLAGLRSPEA